MEAKGRVAEAKADLEEALLNQGSQDVRQARVSSAEADVALAKLNLECDVIAKHVERLMASIELEPRARLTVDDLKEQGF